MSSLAIGFTGLGAVLLLIALRVPIGVALGGVSIVGVMAIRGPWVAAGLVKIVPFNHPLTLLDAIHRLIGGP